MNIEQKNNLLFITLSKMDYSNKPHEIVVDAIWVRKMIVSLDPKPFKEDCHKLK